MEKKESKMHFPTIDDLFTTQQERDDANLEKIVNLPLDDIEDYPEHPFKVNLDEELLNSINDKGVLLPAIVRPKNNGKYEIISGHRRKTASKFLGLKTLPCIVRDLSDDEATIVMVDSNFQREKILPSEKAFAYKMKLEALKHQGIKTDLSSSPLATKLKDTASAIGKDFGDGKDNVYRYIRLTKLIPKILEMVDNDALGLTPKMALRPAVEISYLTKEEQEILLDSMECNDCTPSHEQARKLKELSKSGELNDELIEEILSIQKPNQEPVLRVKLSKLNRILPQSLKDDREKEEYVINAVKFYDVLPQSLKNNKERGEYVIKAITFFQKYQERKKERLKQER